VVEGRESTNNTTHDRHGVSITTEAAEKLAQLLVHHSMVSHSMNELCLLLCIWQFTIQQKKADIHVVSVVSQLLNGVSAVEQDAVAAIDICDLRFTRGG